MVLCAWGVTIYRRAVALRVLLEAGAAVDVQDEHGHTALMLGSKEGHTATALALLKVRTHP